MKVAIWGATGATGSELLQQALDDERIDEIQIFVRQRVQMLDSRVQQFVIEDFSRADSYDGLLQGLDAIFWCLGVSQSAVPDREEHREITSGYSTEAAHALWPQSPQAQFHFVSAMGVGSLLSGLVMWAGEKLIAEMTLGGVYGPTEGKTTMAFSRMVIWRPGYIHVPGGRKSPTRWERVWEILSSLFRMVPGLVNPVGEIARAMLRDALMVPVKSNDVEIRTSRDIRRLGKLKTPN